MTLFCGRHTKYNYRTFYFITFIPICVFASPFYFIEYLVDSLQSFLVPYHRILHVQSIAAVVDLRGVPKFSKFHTVFFFLENLAKSYVDAPSTPLPPRVVRPLLRGILDPFLSSMSLRELAEFYIAASDVTLSDRNTAIIQIYYTFHYK